MDVCIEYVFMKRRIRFRFFVILFIFLGAFAYLFFYLPPDDEVEYVFVKRGEMILRDQGDAVIIREEKIHELPEHGRAEFFVAEGEFIEEGESLATLFDPEYDGQLFQELLGVQERIFNYQRDNLVDDVLNTDLTKAQSAINEVAMDIQLHIRDVNQTDLERKERDLRSLMFERQEILDRTVFLDQYLKDLYEHEAGIKRQLAKSMVEVKAPAAGVVSFSSDGLEEVLTSENIDLITIEDISDLIHQRRTQVTTRSEETIPFFRLIDPYRWFVTFLISVYNISYNVGDEIELRFLDNYQITLSGNVHKVLENSETSMLVIELTDDIRDVINIRAVKAEIGKKKSGYMVPVNALFELNDVVRVRIVQGSSFLLAPVRVLAFGDKYAIIEDVEDELLIDLNTRLMLK